MANPPRGGDAKPGAFMRQPSHRKRAPMHARQGAAMTAAKIFFGSAVVFGYAAGVGGPALAAHGLGQSGHRGHDGDHDGMPTRWELRFGLNPHHANAKGNPDHDRLSNLREFRKGTDPA